MYGFSDNTIKMLIQELPDAEKCSSYIWQDFEGTTKARPSTANSGDDQPMEDDDVKPEEDQDKDEKMQDAPQHDKPAVNIKLNVNKSADSNNNNTDNGTHNSQPVTQEVDAGFSADDFESDQQFPDVSFNL